VLFFGAVALGGALGAISRAGIAYYAARARKQWVGLVIANGIGSVLVMLFLSMELSPIGFAGAVLGFCGALTTFSSFALEWIVRTEKEPRELPGLATASAATFLLAASAWWLL